MYDISGNKLMTFLLIDQIEYFSDLRQVAKMDQDLDQLGLNFGFCGIQLSKTVICLFLLKKTGICPTAKQ